MTIIQNHPLSISSSSVKASTHKVDANQDSFDKVLDTVAPEKPATEKPSHIASQPETEANKHHKPQLDSDIRIPHEELLKALEEPVAIEMASIETPQRLQGVLIQPSLKNNDEVLEEIRRSKTLNLDGTELGTSILIPFVAPDVKLMKAEALDDSMLSRDTSVATVQSYPDAYEGMLSTELDESASFALSQEFVLPAAMHDVNLLNKAQSLSIIDTKLPNGASEKTFNVDPVDSLSDEVPIVSVKITQNVSNAQLGEDASMAEESDDNLIDFQTPEVEDLSPANFDVNTKSVQAPSSGAISDSSTEITEMAAFPTQQVQKAILSAKEGILPKETKTLSIVLNPEELGVVNVQLTADDMGKIKAVLSVEKPETLHLLEQDLHQLKSILNEIGIDDSGVSLELSSNPDQRQQEQSEYVSWDEREHMLVRHQNSAAKPAITEKAKYPERSSTRRLDIKA